MANYQTKEVQVLNFELCGGKVNLPLTVRLQEYPGASDLWHSHEDFAELVIITNGKVINELQDGTALPMQSGDTMIMYPGCIHRYNRIRQLRHYNVLFAPQLMDSFLNKAGNLSMPQLAQNRQGVSGILHLNEKEQLAAISILEKMRQEKLNFSPGHEGAMLAHFYLLLIHVMRHAKIRSDKVNSATFRISQTIRYMEHNSDQPLSLQQLCNYVHMSESSFRHHFRHLTGLSPIDYLIKLRLRRSALMMFHSDQPISNIALIAGFSDGNYFARKFKQIFQVSPRDFRILCASGKRDIFQELEKLQLPDIG